MNVVFDRAIIYRAEHGINIKRETAEYLQQFLKEAIPVDVFREILPQRLFSGIDGVAKCVRWEEDSP